MPPSSKIFISYSHDSTEHRESILSLSDRLRHDGLDCVIDQYVNGFPAEGWQRWMENQIESADFILLVCTPSYLKRYRGLDSNIGRGVAFEGVVISQTLYDTFYRTGKFVPLLPDDGDTANVPLPLKRFSTFRMSEDYEPLYRYLTGQPSTKPPVLGNILELGNRAIPTYFENIDEQGTQQLNEAKLIIVGEPAAGKTSLMETLFNPEFKLTPDTESTLGVQVREGWEFPHPKKENTTFTANIWDFGGQQIQYMTHQFFLTPGATYVLVSANDRKEPTNFPYWLKIIHLLGEEKGVYSPVVVVLNEKNDKFIHNFNFDRKFYEERYPELQIEVCEVNLSKRDDHYQALRNTIQNTLTKLPVATDDRPASWNAIRDSLKERSKIDEHISFVQYAEICQKHHVINEESQLLFSRYLHCLGSLLHFHEDPKLYSFIILNPQWAVDAIYSLLNNNKIALSGGYFEREQLDNFWKAITDENGLPKYNYDERNKLFNLLEKENFEICYPLDDNSQNYIVPQLLPWNPPAYDWDATNNLKFRFQYKFMPEGILPRLIVRLNALISTGNEGKQLVWKNGALFSSNQCQALVEEEENRDGLKVINIIVRGKVNERKYLLRKIRNEIIEIHHKWFHNIQAEQMIPCTCHYCIHSKQTDQNFFAYGFLNRAYEHGKTTVECDRKFNTVPVVGLLENVFNEEEIEQYKKHSWNYQPLYNIPSITQNHQNKAEAPSQITEENKENLVYSHPWHRGMIIPLTTLSVGVVWAIFEWSTYENIRPFEPILIIIGSLLSIAGNFIYRATSKKTIPPQKRKGK